MPKLTAAQRMKMLMQGKTKEVVRIQATGGAKDTAKEITPSSDETSSANSCALRSLQPCAVGAPGDTCKQAEPPVDVAPAGLVRMISMEPMREVEPLQMQRALPSRAPHSLRALAADEEETSSSGASSTASDDDGVVGEADDWGAAAEVHSPPSDAANARTEAATEEQALRLVVEAEVDAAVANAERVAYETMLKGEVDRTDSKHMIVKEATAAATIGKGLAVAAALAGEEVSAEEDTAGDGDSESATDEEDNLGANADSESAAKVAAFFAAELEKEKAMSRDERRQSVLLMKRGADILAALTAAGLPVDAMVEPTEAHSRSSESDSSAGAELSEGDQRPGADTFDAGDGANAAAPPPLSRSGGHSTQDRKLSTRIAAQTFDLPKPASEYDMSLLHLSSISMLDVLDCSEIPALARHGASLDSSSDLLSEVSANAPTRTLLKPTQPEFPPPANSPLRTKMKKVPAVGRGKAPPPPPKRPPTPEGKEQAVPPANSPLRTMKKKVPAVGRGKAPPPPPNRPPTPEGKEQAVPPANSPMRTMKKKVPAVERGKAPPPPPNRPPTPEEKTPAARAQKKVPAKEKTIHPPPSPPPLRHSKQAPPSLPSPSTPPSPPSVVPFQVPRMGPEETLAEAAAAAPGTQADEASTTALRYGPERVSVLEEKPATAPVAAIVAAPEYFPLRNRSSNQDMLAAGGLVFNVNNCFSSDSDSTDDAPPPSFDADRSTHGVEATTLEWGSTVAKRHAIPNSLSNLEAREPCEPDVDAAERDELEPAPAADDEAIVAIATAAAEAARASTRTPTMLLKAANGDVRASTLILKTSEKAGLREEEEAVAKKNEGRAKREAWAQATKNEWTHAKPKAQVVVQEEKSTSREADGLVTEKVGVFYLPLHFVRILLTI